MTESGEIQRELPAGEVIRAALSAGALSPADLVHDGVLVEQVGRSHAVYRVSVGGVARFYVKTFGPRRGATDGLPGRERAVLALAAERDAVRALVPEAWPWTVASESEAGSWTVIATRAVRGAEAWAFDAAGLEPGARERWSALVRALAPMLAAFHRATRDLARPGSQPPPVLRGPEPWPLCLVDGDAAPELWASPMTSTVLREAAADAALVAGLRAARAAWRPLALVHADLKPDNVLVESDGARLRPTVIDWEMARLGDPAWDLAGLTARVICTQGTSPPWSDADLDATAELVRVYGEASGLRAAGLAHRQVLYAGAVLLMMALQHASTLPAGADLEPARSLVLRARATFRSVDGITSAILQRVAAAGTLS